jgi:H+/gluconate symporter-like permease
VRRLMIVISVGLIMAIVMVVGAAPTMAQQKSPAEKQAKQEQKAAKQQQKAAKQQQKQMPKTGGVELNALLLPAGVLLVGSGVVAVYGIRRYRR